MKRFFYVCLILTFCFAPLMGCDQPTNNPTPTPTPPGSNDTVEIPVDVDIDGGWCDISIDNSYDDAVNHDFEMTIVCGQKEWFHIDLDGITPNGGGADKVDIDVFGRDFLNWGK